MGDAEALAALDAMALLAEGDDALRSSSLIAPVALSRDAAKLTSSSKKMRLSASLPRFGMNLTLRLAHHLRGMLIRHMSPSL
jgi:hypothetical protein